MSPQIILLHSTVQHLKLGININIVQKVSLYSGLNLNDTLQFFYHVAVAMVGGVCYLCVIFLLFVKVSPHTSSTKVRFRGSTFLCKFPHVLVHCHPYLHRPQGPTLFQRVRWDFTCVQCNVCTDTGPPVSSLIQED